MSKYSVKKPLTVFVAIIITIVLGVISYTRMTPTLMPNMDLPYMILVTTYPGASPEKVESEVTKPLEESMSTLENIESVTSTSSENYSMVMLEFSEDANLDTATIDIIQNVDVLEASWDDMIGSPTIMKINMDSMPIVMAAVDMEGMDTAEMSQFVEDELMNKLEGINGVAGVTASGLLDEEIEIILSQEKISALNDQVFEAIDEQFAEGAEELEETKAELEDQQDQLADGQSQLEAGQDQLADGLAEAEVQLSAGQTEIQEDKAEINTQIKEMNDQLAELESTEATLKELQSTVAQLNEVLTLEPIASAVESAGGAWDNMTLKEIMGYLGQSTSGMSSSMLGMTGKEIVSTYNSAVQGMATIEQQLGTMGLSTSDIDGTLAEIATGKAQIKAAIATMEGMLVQLDEGNMQLQDAMKELSSQKTKGILEMSSASAQMIVGESTIASALTQIDSGLEQIEEMKDTAYDSADMTNIITMEMVSTILVAQNFSMPVGTLEDDGVSYMITVGDAIESVEELEELLLFDLGMDGVDPIYLTDVADIEITDNSDEIYTEVNGNSGVILTFTKQSNAATAEASDAVADKFEELEEQYDGLSFTNLMDQGDYIYMVVNSIMQDLVFGAVFAVLILFVFLKDLRPTLITLISIPVSVLFAIVLMYFSGVTINMLSLAGLAVAVGMLVDNSVVVIENIYRLRYRGESAVKAAVSGAAQVGGAIMASTLTTICVFLPIIFVEGMTRQLFMDFALTFGFALFASLIIALTLVPAMASGLLVKEPKEHKQPFMDKLREFYEVGVRWMLGHRAITLSVAVVLLIVSVVAALSKGFIFMPEMGGDSVSVTLEMDEGSDLEDTVAASNEAVEKIMGVEGVDTVGAMLESGTSMMMSFGGDSTDTSVTMYVILDEDSNRSLDDIADEINELCADISNAEIEASSAAMMDMGSLMGSGVGVNIYGTDLDVLQETAVEIGEIMATVDGIDEVTDGMEDADPGIKFVVDKEEAMKKGLTVAQVYQEIAAAMTNETTATTLEVGTNSYDVIVQPEEEEKTSLTDLKNLIIEIEGDDDEIEEVRITEIAEIEETETMNSISREDQRRYVAVSGTLEEGENATLVASDLEDALEDYDLPDDVTMEFSGENETTMEAMMELVQMLAIGILLVYLVMVAQFQSLRSPFIIMFTIPLAFTGGFFGLLISGQEISVISMIGFVMLVGLIVNNGIVLVDYINQLRYDGAEKREAIVEAGLTRMRPILMTTVTTILGQSVMLFSNSMGSAMMRPIATVCIGGLAYATIMTLFVVPCMYDLMNRKDIRVIDEEDLIVSDDFSDL